MRDEENSQKLQKGYFLCKGEKWIETGPQDRIENKGEQPQRENPKGKILRQ